jgi:hypothetical protein
VSEDAGLLRPVSRIRDVHPGSEFFPSPIRIFPSRIPDLASKKKLSILTQKNGFQALGNMIRGVHPGSGSRIRILIFYPSRIPDPGVKKGPDPGSDPQHTGCDFGISFQMLFPLGWFTLVLLLSHEGLKNMAM